MVTKKRLIKKNLSEWKSFVVFSPNLKMKHLLAVLVGVKEKSILEEGSNFIPTIQRRNAVVPQQVRKAFEILTGLK